MAQRLAAGDETLAAPHLIDAEVGQVMRRFERNGDIGEIVAAAVLEDLGLLPMTRYPHGPLMGRALEFRHTATMYDALYLALAEVLDVILVTADAALADIPGCRADVEVLPR